jgi:hypothetical protein
MATQLTYSLPTPTGNNYQNQQTTQKLAMHAHEQLSTCNAQARGNGQKKQNRFTTTRNKRKQTPLETAILIAAKRVVLKFIKMPDQKSKRLCKIYTNTSQQLPARIIPSVIPSQRILLCKKCLTLAMSTPSLQSPKTQNQRRKNADPCTC